MTVSSEINKRTYVGDGAVSVFSTGFTFASNGEVVVTLKNDATGVETAWTEGTEYALTGAGTDGAGSVTVDTSPTDYTPAVGETLIIQLKPDFLQGTSLPRGGTTPPKTLEGMVDSVVRQNLRQKDELDRAFKAPIEETSISDLPSATTRANKFLGFDGSGNPIASAGSVDGLTVSAFMQTVIDDADAGTARSTLGAAADADVLKKATTSDVSVGYPTSEKAYGTFASGTLTIDLTAQRIATATNNGAFTIAADATKTGEQVLYITNGASAGVVTLTDWTVVSGSFDTTNGNKFRVFIEQTSVGDYMWIEALQ